LSDLEKKIERTVCLTIGVFILLWQVFCYAFFGFVIVHFIVKLW